MNILTIIKHNVPAALRWGWLLLPAACATTGLMQSAQASEDPLPGWLEQVQEHNQDVVAARKEWGAAKERMRATRSFDDPMIGVEFMRMDSTGLDDIDETEFMVRQRLPWFGKRRARTDTARLRADAAGFRYLEIMRTVRADVEKAYWELWYAQRALSINEENRALLRTFAQIAEARYESGTGIQADRLKARVALAELESEWSALRARVDIAQRHINRLLSGPADQWHEVPLEPQVTALRGSLDEAYADARRYGGTLPSRRLEWEAQASMVQEARLAYRPDIEVRMAARKQSGQNRVHEYDTGVAINVPWLWRGKYRSGIHEAESARESAAARFQAAVDKTLLNTGEAYARALAAWETMQRWEETILPLSRELLESTRAAYENNEAGFLDLIDAQRQWNAALLAKARSRMQYARYKADLNVLIAPWQYDEIQTGLIHEK